MARTARPRPNGGDIENWPAVTRPDPIQETTRQFVVNLKAVIGDSSPRVVAAKAGIDHMTLRNVLSGNSWPDAVVIAKLERAYRTNLWPGLID